MIHGHGGNVYELARQLGRSPDDILDMSSNVNPLGPPPGLEDHLRERLAVIRRLPEADADGIVRAFSAFHGVPADRVVAGNGTTQLIYQLPRALDSRSALILGPTYADYRDACRTAGVPHRFFLAEEADGFAPDLDALAADPRPWDTLFVCNPNNPTGRRIDPERLSALCRRFSDRRVVVDESYLPFSAAGEGGSLTGRLPDNALVLHSMSKIFRIPGLRIGFAVAGPPWIERLRALSMPWSVNGLAQAAVAHVLGRPEAARSFVSECRGRLTEEIEAMGRALSESVPGIRVYPTDTSFLLIRLPAPWTAGGVWRKMADQGILIRDASNFEGLSGRFVRLSVQTPEANRRAAQALVDLLTEAAPC